MARTAVGFQDTVPLLGDCSMVGNLTFQDSVECEFGTDGDVSVYWDGTNLLIVPATDDYLIEIADSAATQKSFDLKWYGNSANGADYVYFDASANLIYTTGVDLQFKDNDYLVIGTGAGAAGDVSFVWDGTNLIIAAVADDTLIEFGDSAATQKSFDIKFYGNDANGATYLYFDASANMLYSVGISLQAGTIYEKTTQTALTDTATVTAAQLLTKVLDGTPTAAATYTLPTAALLVAAVSNCQVGTSFVFVVNNKSAGANTITVAAGSGGTSDGTLTIAQNVIRTFLVIITNVTGGSEAYFVYGIGA